MQSIVYNMLISSSSSLPMGFDLFNILIGVAMMVVGIFLHIKKRKVQWPYLFIAVGFIAVVVNGLKLMSII